MKQILEAEGAVSPGGTQCILSPCSRRFLVPQKLKPEKGSAAMRTAIRRCYAVVVLIALVSLVTIVPATAGPGVRNDSYGRAIKVSHLPYERVQDVTAATATDEPSGIGQTVWFKYTSRTSTSLTADTVGSYLALTAADYDYDTKMAVYTFDGTVWTLVTSNDDTYGIDPDNPTYASRVSFSATAGTTYYFQVGACCGADSAYDSTAQPILQFNLVVTPA